jgi:hypothetical protein
MYWLTCTAQEISKRQPKESLPKQERLVRRSPEWSARNPGSGRLVDAEYTPTPWSDAETVTPI